MKDSYQAPQNIDSNLSADHNGVTHSQIIEALLFSSRKSLTVQQIKKITGIKETKNIRLIIKDLNDFYQSNHRSFSVFKVADGFQLRTDHRFQKWIKKGKVARQIQLSQAVMETLSIVAYQQPVIRAEIEGIRSVDATYALRSLLDKKLIRIVGKKEIMGRPLMYGTTRFFLEVFGFDSLEDLPRPEDFDIVTSEEIQTVSTEINK